MPQKFKRDLSLWKQLVPKLHREIVFHSCQYVTEGGLELVYCHFRYISNMTVWGHNLHRHVILIAGHCLRALRHFVL